MKKNRFITIAAVVLIAAAAYLIYKNQQGTVRKEDRDFAVTDTASVTKVFIADRSGNSVTLERQLDGSWIVNNKYPVRKAGIDLLMDCFYRIRVQMRIPKNAFNNVVKELATTGIKCEIYQGKSSKPAKVYYVGGSTMDVTGTYMMLERSTVPFVTEIPGFVGYLTPRYSALEKDWRNPSVFSYQPEQIKSISMTYSEHPEKSFILENRGGKLSIATPGGGHILTSPDTIKAKIYMDYFRNLTFEAWDYQLNEEQKDSLRQVAPFLKLSVTDVNNETKEMSAYPKAVTATSLARFDNDGNPLKYDLDRMYAYINKQTELVTIQYYVFNKVFVSIDDFDLSKQGIKSPRQ